MADAAGSSGAPSPRSVALSAGAVVLLAAALRFPHLGYGLPATTYVDAFRFVEEARAIAFGAGAFSPSDYFYPGLLKLVLAAIYGTFGVHSPTWLYLVPRILSTVSDIGTVAVVFALARRITSPYGATVAAALHAVTIIAITSARTETADTTLNFFLTAALLVLTSPALRTIHFALGGLLVGCAIGTKFTGGYGLPLLPLAAWISVRQGSSVRRAAGSAALGLALAAGAFLASTPWFLPELAVFRRAFEVQVAVQKYGQIGHVQSSVFDYLVSRTPTWEQPWLSASLLGNMGALVLVAALCAVVAALLGWTGRRQAGDPGVATTARILAAYVVLYYVLVSGTGHVKAIRYLLPVLPALWALIGAGVAALADHPRTFALARALRAPRAALEVALAALLLAYPMAVTLPYLAASARPMTNDLVVAWAAEHVPRGATVLVSPFYVESLRQLDLRIVNLSGAAESQYRFDDALGTNSERRPLFRPELCASMRKSGIQYVVLSSYFEGALSDTEENRRWFPKTVAAYRAFRERLAGEAERLFQVRGYGEGRLGPDIEVYRLRPGG